MTNKENFDNFFDFDNPENKDYNSSNNEEENKLKQDIQTFIDAFMVRAGQRNLVAFGLNILALYLAIKGILYCWSFTAPNITIFWLITFGYFIATIISAGFALRLAVTKVCPNCHQNRALMKQEVIIDTEYGPRKSKTTGKWVKGFSGEREFVTEEEVYQQKKEKRAIVVECKYCDYYKESAPYWEESWEEV